MFTGQTDVGFHLESGANEDFVRPPLRADFVAEVGWVDALSQG
jgi:hypothetical protein